MQNEKYIDIHTHYCPGIIDEKQFIMNMDAANVEKCALLAVPEHERYSRKNIADGTNEVVAELVHSHSDRFIGAVYIDPRATLDGQSTVRKYRDRGFLMVKMWPAHGYYLDDPKVYPVLEVIDHLKMGLLFHSGYLGRSLNEPEVEKEANFNSVYGQPMHIDQPARLFPDIQFIIAHSGYPWIYESLVLIEKHPNIYMDLSCPWGLDGFNLLMATTSHDRIDFSKILWGTDSAGEFSQDIIDWKKRFSKAGLDEQRQRSFFYDNAAALLKRIKSA